MLKLKKIKNQRNYIKQWLGGILTTAPTIKLAGKQGKIQLVQKMEWKQTDRRIRPIALGLPFLLARSVRMIHRAIILGRIAMQTIRCVLLLLLFHRLCASLSLSLSLSVCVCVCVCVRLSVGHNRLQPWALESGWTDCGTVWDMDLGGSRNPASCRPHI